MLGSWKTPGAHGLSRCDRNDRLFGRTAGAEGFVISAGAVVTPSPRADGFDRMGRRLVSSHPGAESGPGATGWPGSRHGQIPVIRSRSPPEVVSDLVVVSGVGRG